MSQSFSSVQERLEVVSLIVQSGDPEAVDTFNRLLGYSVDEVDIRPEQVSYTRFMQDMFSQGMAQFVRTKP
jgi:hypothetical protein